MTDYPDSNSNGIPDAFENRPSITEILNSDGAIQRRDDLGPLNEESGYRFVVGPARSGGSRLIVLEVEGFNRERGACLFRSPDELRQFLKDIQDAAFQAGWPVTQ